MATASVGGGGAHGIVRIKVEYDPAENTIKATVTGAGKVAGAIGKVEKAHKRSLGTMLRWAVGWRLAYRALNLVESAIGGFIRNIVQMETELAHIAVVTRATRSELATMENRVRRLGIAYGTSSTEVAKAAKIYAQQGLTLEQSVKLTEVAIRGALVTGQSIEGMVENLTAAQRAFNLTQSQTAEVLDSWVAVAQKAPVSVNVLAQAYRRAGAAAADLGITTHELNGMIAALAGTMRLTGQMAGTSLTTIFMRMTRGQSIAALRGAAGIESIAPGGERLRSPFAILSELAQGWDQLSGAQQRLVKMQVAGIRRGKEFVSLLRSWQQAQQSTTESINGNQEALRAAGILVDTSARQWERLKEAILGVGAAVWGLPAVKEWLKGMADEAERIRRELTPGKTAAEKSRDIESAPPMRVIFGEWLKLVLPDVKDAKAQAAYIERLAQELFPAEMAGAGVAQSEARRAFLRQQRVAETQQMQAEALAARGGGTFGGASFATFLQGRIPNIEFQRIMASLAEQMGVEPRMMAGQAIAPTPQELFQQLRQQRIGGAGLGMRELAGGGMAGAEAGLQVARLQRQEAERLLEILMQQEDFSRLLLENDEAKKLAAKAYAEVLKAQSGELKAQQAYVKQMQRDIRRAADAWKSAFGAGLKALISGEGTLADMVTGMGQAAFERNIDSLVDRMDGMFQKMGELEYGWISAGGRNAAGEMYRGIVRGGATVKQMWGGGADAAGGRAPVAMAGGGAGAMAAAGGLISAVEVSQHMLDTFGTTFELAELPREIPQIRIEGTQYAWSEAQGAYAPMPTGGGLSGRGRMTGRQLGFAALSGAMQGYALSGGRIEGALASAAGATLGGAAFGPIGAQIGALAGALFRQGPDPVEQERRYDSRIEWENSILDQLMLANRNLIGLREGGTFALPGSYYYRERTNETLAGSLELAMRGA